MMKSILASVTAFAIFSCSALKKEQPEAADLAEKIREVNLIKGDITLCGAGADEFGSISFGQVCSEKIRDDFNLATALLHSFEYTEAEKVFARVIEADPECLMGYWGVAMSNFHPLWAPPNQAELTKGAKVISIARSISEDTTSRESQYIEAIAAIYDNWEVMDHRSRVLRFEKATERLYNNFQDDPEAAVFYALALNAAADPSDKTFQRQKKAGEILNKIFKGKPDHPGIAHYLIHNYDYPELAEFGLPAARRYASIAAASAHAQHMPSHIFTRLGLWDEAIQSNLKSVAAAQCYGEKSGIKGHWDEELHGLDYLMYAYLQQADDDKAMQQLNYLTTITQVEPVNFKGAYCFAAMPARYAVERKDWLTASKLELQPSTFPWQKFFWEKANIHFAKILGSVHTGKLNDARKELQELTAAHASLIEGNEKYKSNLVDIQIKASEAWISLAEGNQKKAVQLMTTAAQMEDATAKHPVTPGEIIPARELLADMLLQIGDYQNALIQYEADLKRHPNKFNDIYGVATAAEKSGDSAKAQHHYEELLALAGASTSRRSQLMKAKAFLKLN